MDEPAIQNYEKVTVAERISVILIFGLTAGIMAMKGNTEAAAGFLSPIVVYFLSRSGT